MEQAREILSPTATINAEIMEGGAGGDEQLKMHDRSGIFKISNVQQLSAPCTTAVHDSPPVGAAKAAVVARTTRTGAGSFILVFSVERLALEKGRKCSSAG